MHDIIKRNWLEDVIYCNRPDVLNGDFNSTELVCVYFIGTEDGIKLGWSKQLKKRFTQIQIDNVKNQKLYGFHAVRSKYEAAELEQKLHKLYAEFRIKGEWFKYEPIIELLNELKERQESKK